MKNVTIYTDDEGLMWLNKAYDNGDIYNAVAYDCNELARLEKSNFIPLSECHDLIKEIYNTIAYGDNGMWFYNDYQEWIVEPISEAEALHILIETLNNVDCFMAGTFTDDSDGLTVYTSFINYFIDDRNKEVKM